MLEVERGGNVDARIQHLQHVLPALGVARAWRIGVGQFVDQGELRPAGQQRVDIHLLEPLPAMIDRR